MSVVRERDWERESVRDGPRHYTTVRRYKVPDAILRDDYDEREEEMKIVRRSETVPMPDRYNDRHSHSDRHSHADRGEVTRRYYEHDVEVDSPRGEVDYRIVKAEVDRDDRGRHVREYRFEREYSRSPSPPEVEVSKDYRYEREDRMPQRSPYALEKYSKSTEYFSRPEHPQPIIIRNEVASPQPIIIQEPARPQEIIVRREEPSYEIIERTEVIDEPRPVVRAAPRQEDDYYYERKTRRVDRGDFYEDERELRRNRYEDTNYHSDDDIVYVRRETTDGWVRDRSPNHKRHLAEGVAAGIGAAELIRHHRKRQGEDPGHRGRQLIGYGALGAVGAEALSRAGTLIKSKSRSRSGSRDGRRKHRHRQRSRSLSRTKTLAGIGAVAALGALAYAAGKSGKNQTTVIEHRPGRSRSRRRRHSVHSSASSSRSRSRSRHMDPEHRNRKIAQGGLVGAALAGLAQRQRSKSREKKGEKSRSRSRVRTGVPIVASGLAGAAVTGLYEKAQAKREKSRSRSRSRSRSVHSNHSRRRGSDGALVEYGGDPIYTDDSARGHRYRSRSRTRRHHRSTSRDSKSRSRSRGKHIAEAAALAGAAGLAANEMKKRKDKKRMEEEERKRAEANLANPPTDSDQSPGGGRYYPDTMEFAPPPPNHYTDPNPAYNAPPAGFDNSQPAVNTYPHTNTFAPPPTQPVYDTPSYNREPIPPGIQQQPYNPAEFGPAGTNLPVGANVGYYQQHPQQAPFATGPGVRGHAPEDMV